MNVAKGAFWIKEKNGKQWLSGNVEIDGTKFNVTLFKNDYATDDNKQPHWRSPKDEKPKDPSNEVKFDGSKFSDDTPF